MEKIEKSLYQPENDEIFRKPLIDYKEKRKRQMQNGKTISYQYMHGKFDGTNVKFTFCFPEKEQYGGRFFQHLSPFPGPDEELAAMEKYGDEDFVAFALTHGASYVESNMGSGAIFGSEADSTIFYRSSAAVAEYCRQVAKELYGEHRVYGYVYGGSGGGYKTMSCIENTSAWDGAVPFVIGSPVSLPNCLTVFAHGSRLLRNCWSKIVDALEPGGSGDLYKDLNEEERSALIEITQMGYPPRMCVAFGTEDDGSLPVLAPVVHRMDSEYFTDFWTKEGYLGTETNSSALRDRIYMRSEVVTVSIPEVKESVKGLDERSGTDDAWQKMMTDGSTAYIEVQEVPRGEDLFLRGVDIIFESGAAKGKKLRLGSIEGNRLIPGKSYGLDSFEEVLRLIQPGDEIILDNSDYIAIQTYHRHQIPADPSFHAWDQYKNEQGQPMYPQRANVISYGFTIGGCGSVQDGKIQGKVIVMNNLMDGNFPWQADWYRRKVEEVYGVDAKDCFRLWYNDNCPHGDIGEVDDKLRVVSYLGMLRQALLDLAEWVEKGIAPANTSGYQLNDNQIILETAVDQRGGIQPMAELFANGSKCARVQSGQSVTFCAKIEIPEAAGTFTKAEWSFEGETDFPFTDATVIEWEEKGYHFTTVETRHVFNKPGFYFCVVRITTNRNREDDYTQLKNLSRVQVIVEE